jgi:ATP-dependent Clp protease ATP-binding subunit ClpB
VDDIVLFKPLSRAEIKSIVDLQTADLRKRLTGRRIALELTEAARDFIAESAYDPVFGARPLKRFLQHQLETRLGRALIAGDIRDGATITVDAGLEGLTFSSVNPAGKEETSAI